MATRYLWRFSARRNEDNTGDEILFDVWEEPGDTREDLLERASERCEQLGYHPATLGQRHIKREENVV